MRTFKDIIKLWPSKAAFAADIGTSPQAVTNMIGRKSVPARYWTLATAAAARRGITGATLDAFAEAATMQRAGLPSSFTTTCTEDGTWLARCGQTGVTASGSTLAEALAELRRLLAVSVAA